MKTLIADDDFTSRLLMQKLLEPHGAAHVVINGIEAVEAVRIALEEGAPYDLVCLDIMMPGIDGQEALARIRQLEAGAPLPGGKGACIVMTTALADTANVMRAARRGCDLFLVKPIDRGKLEEALRRLQLVSGTEGT